MFTDNYWYRHDQLLHSQLLSTIGSLVIKLAIIVGPPLVKFAIITKGTPLRANDDMRITLTVSFELRHSI